MAEGQGRVLTKRVVSNVDDCRLETEISGEEGSLVAVVYEDRLGWHIDAVGDSKLALDDRFLAEVKADLARYVNRKGDSPPKGLTRSGLALWLMIRDDGTAMGLPVE